MKVYIITVLLTLVVRQTFGQGSIQFNNRITGTTTSAVVAPIYGTEPPPYPIEQKTGNAATGPTTPIPTGTQTYAGPPLVGSGYTASLWARPAGTTQPFVQAATTPFRTTTSTSLYGFWTVPGTATVLPNVPSDPTIRAEIIIRVWDNRNGSVTSWDQFFDPNTRQLNPLGQITPHGESLPFVVADQLGGGVILPPTLHGLQSFSLAQPVPEPSALALLGLLLLPLLKLTGKSRRS